MLCTTLTQYTYQGRQFVLSLLSTSRPAVQVKQVGLQAG